VFIAGLGNGAYLGRAGIDNAVELDWWQAHTLEGGMRIVAVPTQHWSKRSVFDTNRALWLGFVIEHSGQRIFYPGDTGYGSHFSEIRARLGAPDLALLPIGAYLPRWFMRTQHVSPKEAVDAHIAIGARHSMAVHFGTFALGDDGQDEPVVALRAALADAGLGETFWIPANGERRHFAAAAAR
jgi:L-ascorbate metabolism protein UlaG (beta-lactamase superfamily)